MKALKVILNRPRAVGHFMTFSRFVASRMEANPYFPSPPLPIATLEAHITELETAHALMLSQRKTKKARDAKLSAVVMDLLMLAMYVQTVAVKSSTDAEAIVASAGMSIKRFPGPGKVAFAVKQGKLSGTVELVVRHPGGNATFYWQRSADGTTWIDEEDAVIANTTIEGLTPGQYYWFRYRVRTSAGLGNWSQVLTLLVV
jgi:hypothetical protein